MWVEMKSVDILKWISLFETALQIFAFLFYQLSTVDKYKNIVILYAQDR